MTHQQGLVLRAMLRLASFTAQELADGSGQRLVYVQNFLSGAGSGYVQKVSGLKLGKRGAPHKVWALKSGMEAAIIGALGPFYESMAANSNVGFIAGSDYAPVKAQPAFEGIAPRRHRYQFIDAALQNDDTLSGGLFGTVVELLPSASGYLISEPSARRFETEELDEIVFIDAAKVASGIASLVGRNKDLAGKSVAAVTLRENQVDLGIVKDGEVLFARQVQVRLGTSRMSFGGRFFQRLKMTEPDTAEIIIEEVQKMLSLYQTVMDSVVCVYLVGSSNETEALRRKIAKRLNLPCEILNAADYVATPDSTVPQSRIPSQAFCKYAPEVGYAMERFEKKLSRSMVGLNQKSSAPILPHLFRKS